MPPNIQNVNFMSPQAMLAPDLAVQQQQAQRQQELADALRQMSFAPIPDNGGNHSWTQGVAKLAQALAARTIQSRADKQQISLNQVMAQRMGSMFGQPAGGGGPTSGVGGVQPQPTPPASIASPAPTIQVPDSPSDAGNAAPVAASPTAPQQGRPDTLAALPPQAAPQPQAAPMPPQGPQRGAWSMTGDPHRDMALYMSNPEEYSKALIANASKGSAPTDIEVMQQHLAQAVQAGDMGTAQAILGAMQKANYIAPINARQNGVVLSPDGKTPIFQVGSAPTGSAIDYADGKPNTMHAISGAPQTIATLNAAEAGGKAAGQSPYEMVQVFNKNTGQMEYVPKSTMVGGGAPATGGSGPVGALYGSRGGGPSNGGFAAGPPLGQSAASDAYGKFSGGAFGDIQAKAANSPQALASLREMSQLANSGQASTGPAAARLQQIGQEHGIDFLTKPGNFAFNKDAARYIAQSAANVGLSGSDARLGMVANATPGQYMPLAALNKVLPVAQGLEMANMAQADAAGKYGQTHPNDIGGFQSFWRRNFDPTTFTEMAKGSANFKQKYLPSLSAPQRAVVIGKLKALQNAGVNFSAFDQ